MTVVVGPPRTCSRLRGAVLCRKRGGLAGGNVPRWAVMARAVSLRKEGVVLKNHLTAPPLRESDGKAVNTAA